MRANRANYCPTEQILHNRANFAKPTILKVHKNVEDEEMNDLTHQKNDRAIAIWLMTIAAVIFGMIILGGVTRLTQSGLSMVDWKPVTGIIPPLNEEEWNAEFEKYKQFPEYQKKHINLDLDGFKSIFYFEYSHRVLGRTIGMLFLLPFLYFWFRKKIKPGLTPKLIIMFILGGLQGVLGWYMVKSGLVNDPHVSQYRLTAHLGSALVIYIYILWTAFGLLMPNATDRAQLGDGLAKYSKWIIGLLFLMILSGGLVAGTRAGLVFPTWPLMGDSFVPSIIYHLEPWWLSAFEDQTTIQFNHRIFAYIMFTLIVIFSVKALMKKPERMMMIGIVLMLITLFIQVLLGISTLIMHVPVSLGAAHQGGAVVLLTAVLFVVYRLHQK